MNIKESFRKENLNRGISYLKRNGVMPSVYKALERIERDKTESNGLIVDKNDVFDAIARKEQREIEEKRAFTHNYKISIVVPAYETDSEFFRKMVQSVILQTYSNWELCIYDASESDRVKYMVESLMKEYDHKLSPEKIKYVKGNENKGISLNTNEALKLATGEYIGLLDHDDELSENALYEVMEVLEAGLSYDGVSYTNSVKMIYSDEDKINGDGTKHFDFHRKPDFDLDLLRSNNYVCHFLVVRRELALKVNGFKSEYDGSQDHDFILRCVENVHEDEIKHIDKILYHWRSHEKSTATNPESKLYAYEAGKRAVKDHLNRMNVKSEVEDSEHLGFYRVKYKVTAEDLAQITILTLKEFKNLSYDELQNMEEKYIMILNHNVKPLDHLFLEDMLGYLLRDDVGCVGGLVIGKNGKIESAGYTRIKSDSDEDSLIPDFAGLNRHFSGYLHRAKLPRKVDGVCTDCMMIKKSSLKEDKKLKKDQKVIYTPYSVFKRI